MAYRANDVRANGTRANGNRANVVAPFNCCFYLAGNKPVGCCIYSRNKDAENTAEEIKVGFMLYIRAYTKHIIPNIAQPNFILGLILTFDLFIFIMLTYTFILEFILTQIF